MPDNKTWLLIDCSCLLHRAWHTVGKLEHDGNATGVIFGFLKQVKSLQSRFQTKHVAFAFDCGPSKRQEVCKTYKAGRKKKPRSCSQCLFEGGPKENWCDGVVLHQCSSCLEQDQRDNAAYGEFKTQCSVLRTDYLPNLGYRNVFSCNGFEADDVIASVVKYSLPKNDGAITVSSDHDLYQLLQAGRMTQWLPHKKELYDESQLIKDYEVKAKSWPSVLATAGCPGDGVIGVKGVGLKTACKFYRRELKAKSKAFGAIHAAGELISKNLTLVELPYPGTPKYELSDDDCTPSKWRSVCVHLGFNSLLGER